MADAERALPHLRDLQPADSAAIAALARVIWHEHYPSIIPLAQIDYMLARGYAAPVIAAEITRGVAWVGAWQDGGVDRTGGDAGGRWVGFCAAEAEPDADRMFVHKLYVAAGARVGGIGRRLLGRADDLARARGLGALELRVNKRNTLALDAYARLGFVRAADLCEAIGNGFVMDDWLLRRPCAASPRGADSL